MKTLFAISAMDTSTTAPRSPSFAGRHGNEHPGIERIEEHLEERIEGHQAGRVFRVALGQFIPHDDHGNAPRQADHDQPGHVFRIAAQEYNRQTEHQDRPHHPVLHERQTEHLLVAKDFVQFLVSHLGERRIHHDNQSHGDRDGRSSNAETVQKWHHSGHKPPEHDPGSHGRKDPGGEIAIEKLEANACLHLSVTHSP